MNSRKSFIAGSAAAFASIAIVRAPAKAAQFQYKFAHNEPEQHPLNVRAKELWDRVRRETNGRLAVATYPNSQLGSDTSMISQLRTGAIQFHTQTGSILAQIAPITAIQGVPFAFKSSPDVHAAFDGELGSIIRKDIESRGEIKTFNGILESGFRQITSATHPIRNLADLSGFKIRTPSGPAWVDLFRSLGADVAAIGIGELYTALQTHIVDGEENPYTIIEFARIQEVQKYLSVTNHMWDGWWFLANADAWKALPPDIQAVVERNVAQYVRDERRDVMRLNVSLAAKLSSQGMIFNTTDTSGFKPKLKDYYAKWKSTYGTVAWNALEKTTGRLA